MTDMQKIKETVMKGEGYLHIKRLPKNTVNELIDYLNNEDEFSGDWAMGMKHIWDTYKGMITLPDEKVMAELESLHARVFELESKLNEIKSAPQPESEKKRRFADGSVKK